MTALAAELGLEYHLDRVRAGNTFDAHRLIHLAATHGRGDAVKERLVGGLLHGRPGRSATAPRSPRWPRSRDWTGPKSKRPSTGRLSPTRCEPTSARATALGATGVPFFVIDEAYGVAGAQGEPMSCWAALEQAWSASHPITVVEAPERGPDGGACADGVCAV